MTNFKYVMPSIDTVKPNMETGKFGEYAFLAGVLIATIAGIAGSALPAGTVTLLLVVLGIVAGVLNITERETTPFLVAAVALIAAGTANFSVISVGSFALGAMIDGVVKNIAVFVAPGAIIVAVKAIWALASSK